MLRNRHRKDTTAVPFRIRNNFKRSSTLDYIFSREKVSSDNDDNEMMSLDETLSQKDSDDDETMSQILGQRSSESEKENCDEILPESDIEYDDDYEEREYDDDCEEREYDDDYE